MEYTIDKDGRRIAETLPIAECYEIFVLKDGKYIDLGVAASLEEAAKIREEAPYPNEIVWVWDDRTNN